MLDIQAAADLTDDGECVIGVCDEEDGISPVWLFPIGRWQADKDLIAPLGYWVRHIPNLSTDQRIRAAFTPLDFGRLRLSLRNVSATEQAGGHDNCAHDVSALHCGVIPIVCSHVSTSRGQSVIGFSVCRKPNACPPCAYRCISTGAPTFAAAT